MVTVLSSWVLTVKRFKMNLIKFWSVRAISTWLRNLGKYPFVLLTRLKLAGCGEILPFGCDGSRINSVAMPKDQKFITSGDEFGLVCTYNNQFPINMHQISILRHFIMSLVNFFTKSKYFSQLMLNIRYTSSGKERKWNKWIKLIFSNNRWKRIYLQFIIFLWIHFNQVKL